MEQIDVEKLRKLVDLYGIVPILQEMKSHCVERSQIEQIDIIKERWSNRAQHVEGCLMKIWYNIGSHKNYLV